jgi:MoaA/NifB/PqqE/SkfB family radical SAM enzyme
MSDINLKDSEVAYVMSNDRPRFFVYWSLGNTCTYSCSYCPSRFHDGSVSYQPLDVIQRVMKKLSTLPTETNIMFTGGEATFHPDFEKIVNEAPDRVKVSVISNASRPYPFWDRIVDKLHVVVLTYHAEFANLDRFIKTADLIFNVKKKSGAINLTMNPELWDTCVSVYNTLIANNLSVNVKVLLEDFGYKSSRMIPAYTAEQIVWIHAHTKKSTDKSIGIYNKADIKINSTNSYELLALKQTDFSGWTCYNPTKYLDIDWNGTVHDSACAQRRNVGSIYTDFTIATEPVLCRTNFCWCHGDIQTKKAKNVL